MQRLLVGALLLYAAVQIVREARTRERLVLREHGDELDLCEAYPGHNELFRSECAALRERVGGTSALHQLPRAACDYVALNPWSVVLTALLLLWPAVRWAGRRARLWWCTLRDWVLKRASARK